MNPSVPPSLSMRERSVCTGPFSSSICIKRDATYPRSNHTKILPIKEELYKYRYRLYIRTIIGACIYINVPQ